MRQVQTRLWYWKDHKTQINENGQVMVGFNNEPNQQQPPGDLSTGGFKAGHNGFLSSYWKTVA